MTRKRSKAQRQAEAWAARSGPVTVRRMAPDEYEPAPAPKPKPRTQGTNPRAKGTNLRAIGTNPRAGSGGWDAAYARRIVRRAIEEQQRQGIGCDTCGGRGTFSPWNCRDCEPVLFVHAVDFLRREGIAT